MEIYGVQSLAVEGDDGVGGVAHQDAVVAEMERAALNFTQITPNTTK